MGKTTADVKLADEIWIATALLHREHPDASDFAVQEIKARLIRENLAGEPRPGIGAHLSQHCVANRPASTGRYLFLFETAPNRRRLYRPGDPHDPKREGARVRPRRDEIPDQYHYLIDWYEREWAPGLSEDPLIALAVRHRDLWSDVDADAYVRSLREGFE